jgi:ribose transport system permease protein
MSGGSKKGFHGALNQERIVLVLSAVLFLSFSVLVPGFLTAPNVLSLVQNVAILGILAVGLMLTIIGRGIDLSMIAVMAMSVAWPITLINAGWDPLAACLLGAGFALVVGLINGVVVAYVEVPAIFATLAIGSVVYGFGQFFLVSLDVAYVGDAVGRLRLIGSGATFGIPNSVLSFISVCVAVGLLMKFTAFGRYLYAMGDNPAAARVAGVPTRKLVVVQYMLAAMVAFLAGLVTAMAVSSMNTRVVNSTLIYDVILVAVIGGVGLSGGKGSTLSVIFGTILIGTLLNGMTIANLDYTTQNIIKGVVLLIAIIVDSILNPRDEQTSQQGDI